ncbi:MAG: hypothetical protein JNK23_14995 [Opitutaceae bacterium]|nr:hypothetical protein [Opitutaceae bacterium]
MSPITPDSLSPITGSHREEHLRELFRHWGILPERWFVVFYGRNVPGSTASWTDSTWRRKEYGNFECFLRVLGKIRLRVLYAPYDKERWKHLDSRRNFLRKDAGFKIESESRLADQFDYVHWGATGPAREVRRDWLSYYNVQDRLTGNGKLALRQCVENLRQKFSSGKFGDEHRALYAAMLFRQSRHFSAFLSHAIFPCPHRFETAGIDNDWMRYEKVDGWIQAWNREYSLFLRKPGGFFWAYQETRLTFEELIGQQKSVNLEGGGFFQEYRASRARTHFEIGEWYARAYRSTGHVLPILEAIHHFGQCIEWVDRAAPASSTDDNESLFRRLLFQRSVFELTKMLRLGRARLHFWLQGEAANAWFRTQVGQTAPLPQALHDAIAKAQIKCREADLDFWRSSLAAEFAHAPSAGLRESLSNPHPLDTPDSLFGKDDKSKSDAFDSRGAETTSPPAAWRHALKTNLESWPLEYDASPKIHLLDILASHETSPEGRFFDAQLKKWRNAALSETRNKPRQLLTLAQTVFELAYTHVRRAKMLQHAAKSSESEQLRPTLDSRVLWVEVCGLCWLALNLCYYLPPALLVQDAHLRIKTLTLYGLALGWLGRFHEAHRNLDEAHAWLSKLHTTIDPIELGIIKVRQAEVHVLEATRLRRLLDLFCNLGESAGITFTETVLKRLNHESRPLRQKIHSANSTVAAQWFERYLNDPKHGEKTPEDRPRAKSEIVAELYRAHCASLDNAWMVLEGAERGLSGKSHPAIWWGRLHSLRLRVIAEHWWPKESRLFSDLQLVPYRTLAFRKPQDHLKAIEKIYRAGRLAARPAPFYQLRFVDYAHSAIEHLIARGTIARKDPAVSVLHHLLNGHLKDAKADLSKLSEPLVDEYCERLKTRQSLDPEEPDA